MSFLYANFIKKTALAAFLLINIFTLTISTLSYADTERDTSWHISALRVSYDNEKQIYIAEGDVVITGVRSMPDSDNTRLDSDKTKKSDQNRKKDSESNGDLNLNIGGPTMLKADYVEFSNITRNAVASGNVLLISGKDNITCDRLKLNLETETGTVYNGTIFMKENHFYIKGDTIEKSGKTTYRADRASVTSCDGENPDWKLSGRDIKVTIDGYGTAKNATLWAGNIPALYSPVILFPAKTKRQTGLLAPRVSSSNRKGFELEQPLYLAVSRNSDITLYGDYMSDRGMKTGVEYRYILSDKDYGTLFYDYLNDDKIDDGTSATNDYRFASTPTRSNSDRYWFRMKNSHTFGDNWNTRLDIDYVSDADYLQEFKSEFTGFTSTKQYFKDTFGRSIDEYDDTTRKNSLSTNRTWVNASLNMGVQWFDNVVARQTDGNNTTLQTLPSIEFNTVRKKVGKTPLYYDIDSEYRYFYREDTFAYPDFQSSSNYFSQNENFSYSDLQERFKPLLSGHRTDIYPRLYMPLRFGAFYLEPSAGVRQSMWYTNTADSYSVTSQDSSTVTSESDTSLEITQFNHREMIDLNMELSTKLSRVFDTDKLFADKIKHEILPKIEYSFTPDISQEELPYFDDLDYIEEENLVSWSLGNRLIYRKKNKISPPGNSKRSGSSKDSDEKSFIYREFAWMEISQSYRIEPTRQEGLLDSEELFKSEYYLQSAPWLRERGSQSKKYFKTGKSFSNIYADIEFSPVPFFSFNSDLEWSPHDNRFTSHESGITIKDTRGDSLETWYRYEDAENSLLSSESESLFASVNTKLTNSLNLFFAFEHNLIDNENIESHTGLYFKRPCWSMRISYSDTLYDETFSFIVNLRGIGEFGKK